MDAPPTRRMTLSARLEAILASPLFLAAVLALGVVDRLRRYLACLSYWYDEAYLLLNVFDKSFAELAGPLRGEQAAPPLLLAVLRGLYLLAGPGEWVMRLPSFLAGLAALFLMLPLARRAAGRRGSPWAVGWCALSHHAVYHGAEVKPYAGDLLATEIALLATAVLLGARASRPHRRNAGRAVLLLGAALGPWLSFPSTFVLGGAALALLLEARRRRDRSLGWTGLVLGLLLAASCAGLWYTAARHQNSPALQRHWAAHFPDLSSFGAAVAWTLDCGVRTGHYATTGLGVPLLLLAVSGLAVLGRRSPALAVMLAAPLGLAWVASALHHYPLGNRLLLFAAPCLWLAAAVGVEAGVRRLRRPGVSVVAALALLLPGAVSMGKSVLMGPTGIDFREAFAHVHQHQAAGDQVWVSHPEVYEAYFGRPAWLLGPDTPLGRVGQVAKAGRLWLIFTTPGPRRASFAEVFRRLEAAGSTPIRRHRVRGLDIVLYAPKPTIRRAT